MKPAKPYILLIPSWYPPAGGGFFEEQAGMLARQGTSFVVLANELRSLKKFSFKDFFHSSPRVVQEGPLIVIRKITWKIPYSEWLNFVVWTKVTLSMARFCIKRFGLPSLIHAHSAHWAGEASFRLAKKYAIPYMITEHRGRFTAFNPYAEKCIKKWHKRYLKKVFRSAASLAVVSPRQADTIRLIAGKECMIEWIPNMVDEQLFLPRQDIPLHPFFFVSVSVHEWHKGLDILLHAFARVAKETDNVYLRLIGEGVLTLSLKQMATALGIDSKVIFLGKKRREEVAVILARSHVYVSASRIEGNSVSINEALVTGLPVVSTLTASSAGEIPSWAGKLSPPDDVDLLARNMREIYLSYTVYSSQQIRKAAIARYGTKVFTKKYLQIYNRYLC